jgi:hypothetical protein
MSEDDVEYDPPEDEPQLLAFVRNYWERKRGRAPMPRRQDIVPSDMRTLLRHILLADIVDGGKDFRYRLVGSELQRFFTGNPTGMLMSDALAPFGPDAVRRTIHTYQAVLARRAPFRIRGDGALYSQHAKIFDALLAPLSDDGVTPNMIIGTFIFVWDFHAAAEAPRIVEPDEIALAYALVAGRA